ncbi:hypothetical protein [Lactococcus garvieae]
MFDLVLFFNIVAGIVIVGKLILIIRHLPRLAFDFLVTPNCFDRKRKLRLTINGKTRKNKT